jgi:hypothetical protein
MIFYWLGNRPQIFSMQRLSAALALACAFAAQAQQITFTPFHKTGIYELGERVGWAAQGAGAYSYEIRKNNRDVIQAGTLDLASGSPTIETTVNEPAMLYVEVLPTASATPPSAGAKPSAIHVGAAIAPWKLQPSVPRPADFDSFWDSKLKDLSQIPINPVLTPTPTAQPGVELSTIKLDSLGSHVQGYFAKPSKEGKFPALVIFQYAGVYALRPETVTDRAAEGWLTLDVDSHDMPPNQATGVSSNYQAIGNTDRETSYFLNMYLRDSRAIDYLDLGTEQELVLFAEFNMVVQDEFERPLDAIEPLISGFLLAIPLAHSLLPSTILVQFDGWRASKWVRDVNVERFEGVTEPRPAGSDTTSAASSAFWVALLRNFTRGGLFSCA